ncbi:hypothetical protein N8T08_005718 [Aspergillus melleus]|uniref:Uncharacterized protein n=1 Tax=Aspergillus melleus TaxID=138277 RepID=A0ACC3B1K5_9EURO|nr:hypothetical protein N8T08_005718 [Aspergillus melleus]
MKFAATLGLAFVVLTSAVPYSPPSIAFQPLEVKPWEKKPWETKPFADTVTVKLANDWNGKHAHADVPVDRKEYSIESLYGKSDLVAEDGNIYATSAELTKFGQRTGCAISLYDNPEIYVQLDAQTTWAFLDRGAWVNVKDGYVVCVE